ncbi:MAG TPA: ABC transporter permease, partial [Thermoanaerobaculia bacterium]
MEFRELVRSAFNSLASQWLRTALTLLGVAVGIGAVVAVMVLGEGSKRLVTQEIRDVGQNLFVVGIEEGDSVALAKEGELSIADAEAVERGVPSVVTVIPHASQIASVKVRDGKRQVYVLGTTERLPELRDSLRLRHGRFLSRRDVQGARKVAVISWQLEKELASGGSALGRRIFLGNVAVRVIGVTAKGRQSALAGSGPPRVYVPVTTFHRLFQTRRVEWLEARAADAATLDETMKRTVKLIDRRHRGSNEYAGESLEETIQAASRAIDMLSLAIALIAGISLFVASIGVMNVMLVS